jgi:ferrous iron transport protein A
VDLQNPRFDQLPSRTAAVVEGVEDRPAATVPGIEQIARRLREPGFVDSERVEMVAAGPFGADPLLAALFGV